MENSKYKAPAAKRALDILELMANENKNFTVSEISAKLNITSNSVFRIFVELETKGYVRKNQFDSSYQLTSKLYYLGNLISDRITLKNISFQSLHLLSDKTKETTLLTTFGKHYTTLIVDQVVSSQPFKFAPENGYEYSSHASAMGKCMLSYLEDSGYNEFLKNNTLHKLTDKTITDSKLLKKELEIIRSRAYAYDMEESLIGLRCVAAPIFNRKCEIEGSIGISGPVFRISNDKLKEYTVLVKKEAAIISKNLGYQTKDTIINTTKKIIK